MTVAMAYLRRDFLIWSSYRLAAFWQVVGVFMTLGMVLLAGSALGDRSDVIEAEGGSYIAFILLGLAFMDLLMQGLGSLPKAISDNQRAGTLEPMLLTPITPLNMMISFWLFKFLFSTFRMLTLISFGMIALGYWSSANPLTVVAILIPAVLTFMAMGAFSAAFTILIKQGDPILIAYAGITALLGGAIFPPDALPGWLQPITQIIPLTHALSGIREGFSGGGPADVIPQLLTLTVMAAMMLPPGFLAFSWAIDRAKREGSLGEY